MKDDGKCIIHPVRLGEEGSVSLEAESVEPRLEFFKRYFSTDETFSVRCNLSRAYKRKNLSYAISTSFSEGICNNN